MDPFTAGLLTGAAKKLVDVLSQEQTCQGCSRMAWTLYRLHCCSRRLCKACLDRTDCYETNCCEKPLCDGCLTRWKRDPTLCGFCGKRFGPAPAGGGGGMIGGNQPKGDPRVRRAIEEAGYTSATVDADGDFRLALKLDGERTQVGFINSNTDEYEGIEVREVWSFGYIFDGRPDADVMHELLRRNAKLKIGGWRLGEPTGDGKVAAMFAAQIAAGADGRTLDAVICLVWGEADRLERELFGTDKF